MAWVGKSLAGRETRCRRDSEGRPTEGARLGEACLSQATPEDPPPGRAAPAGRVPLGGEERAPAACFPRPLLPFSYARERGRGGQRAPRCSEAFVANPRAERGFCKAGQIKMSSIILFDRMIPYDEVSAPKGAKW